jgi:hypothetical protein
LPIKKGNGGLFRVLAFAGFFSWFSVVFLDTNIPVVIFPAGILLTTAFPNG